MEEQSFGGWGSPRARAVLRVGGRWGRKDHTVPLSLEQNLVCGAGDRMEQQEHSPALMAHPYLGLKPWPGLLCLAEV